MLTRRHLLRAGLGTAGVLSLPAGSLYAAAGPQTLKPAICGSTLRPILSWNNIPEYKSESPRRTSLLEPGIDFWEKTWPGSAAQGQRLDLVGRVLTTQCQPIARTRLEFWHTNSSGLYDYTGYDFRGLQNSDDDGRYRLETMMPGYYSERRHIHYLVGIRLDDEKTGILVTGTIDFPHDDEFKSGGAGATVPPHDFTKANGVLTASYDFVIDVG